MKNFLLACYKPPFVSSNYYLGLLKKQLNIKKLGFLGTLDPFASGLLIVASAQYTKILGIFDKLGLRAQKSYRATLWLGASSKSLDIENIESIHLAREFKIDFIKARMQEMCGELRYDAPIFSAKHVKVGDRSVRAYKVARSSIHEHRAQKNLGELGEKLLPKMPEITSMVSLQLLHYNHPFICFNACVSKGAYIRALAQILATHLGESGTLSALHRFIDSDINLDYLISQIPPSGCKGSQDFIEQGFDFIESKSGTYPYFALSVDKFLGFEVLNFKALAQIEQDFYNGKKLYLRELESKPYIVHFKDFFSIIEVLASKEVRYICNQIPYTNVKIQF